jgi:F-type H+-transporting ATPase subunit delta
MNRVSRRYAAAIFDYAAEQGQRERVSADLAALAAALDEVPEIIAIASTPSGAKQSLAIIERAFSGRVHPITWRFIELLARKRRLPLLREIVESFDARCEKVDGVVSISLASSHPLDDQTVTDIGARIGLAVFRWPRVRAVVQPDLIGGFVARHDDKVYDFSLAGAAQQLRQRLAENAANPGTAR